MGSSVLAGTCMITVVITYRDELLLSGSTSVITLPFQQTFCWPHIKFPKSSCAVLWWVDLGYGPNTHPAARSLPLWNRTGRENCVKKLMGQHNDREIAYQLPPRGKINLIYCQLKMGRDGKKQRQELKQLPCALSFFPGSASLLHSRLLYLLLPKRRRGNGECGGLQWVRTSSSLLLLPPPTLPLGLSQSCSPSR